MPLSYRQVSDMYDSLKSQGVVSTSLPDFSTDMNRLTKSSVYDAGLHDNWIKRSSVGVDRFLERTGAVQLGGEFGRAIGGVFGMGNAGEAAGRGIPRGILDFAPLLIPGVDVGYAAAAAGVLAGTHTYAETGSPAAGVASGITSAILPKVAEGAGQMALERLGLPLIEGPVSDAAGKVLGNVSRRIPETFGQKAAAFGAGQAGAFGTMGVGAVAEQALDPNQKVDLGQDFGPQALLALGLQTLPFTGVELAGHAMGLHGKGLTAEQLQANITKTREVMAKRDAKEKNRIAPPVTKVPPAPANDVEARMVIDTANRLAEIRTGVKAKSENPQPEDVDEINRLLQEEASLMQRQQPSGTTVFGEKQTPASDRTPLVGTVHYQRKGFMMVRVSDDPANVTNGWKPGEIVSYSNPDWAPQATAGPAMTKSLVFQVPNRFHTRGVVDKKLTLTPALAVGNETVQGNPGETHQDIFNRYRQEHPDEAGQLAATMAFGDDTKHIFVDNNGKTYDRATGGQLADQLGLRDKSQTGQPLHSEHLIGQQNLPVGQDNPVPMDHVAMWDNVNAKLATATTPDELRAVVVDANNILAAHGWPEISDKRIAAESARVSGDETAATANVVRRGQKRMLAKLAFQEESGKAQDLYTAMEEHRAKPDSDPTKDPATADRAVGWLGDDGLRKEVLDKKGGDALEATGVLDHEFWKWDQAGRQGGLDVLRGRLDDRLANVRKRGGMTVKATAEQAPILDEMEPRVQQVLAKVRNSDENIENKKMFTWLLDRYGTDLAHIGDLSEAARDYAEEVGKVEEPSAEDVADQESEFEQFLATPQAKGWLGEITAPMERKAFGRSRVLAEDTQAVPLTSPEARQIAANAGIDHGGVGMVEALARSSNPLTSAIAKHLQQQFPQLLSRIEATVSKTRGASWAGRTADGKVRIAITHGTLSMDSYRREQHILHEVIHGLTLHQVHDTSRPEILQGLQDLSKRLENSLSKADKAALDKARASDWLARYQSGHADMSELHPDFAKANILYGLLDTDELLAQGYSSREMQQFMQGVKSDGTTGWKRFTNWVKTAIGFGDKVQGTAFDEFLNRSSALMDEGEHIATFTNYAEGAFRQMGLPEELVSYQAQRALGVVLSSRYGMAAPDVIDTLSIGRTPSQALVTTGKAMTEHFSDPEESAPTKKLLSELGHEASPAGVDDFIHSTILEHSVDTEPALRLLPEDVLKYVYAKLHDYAGVLDVIRAASASENSPFLNFTDPSQVHGPVKAALRMVTRVLGTEREYHEAVATLKGLSAVDPAAFMDKHLAPDEKPKTISDFVESPGSKAFSWFKNMLQQAGQLSRTLGPAGSEFFERSFHLSGLTRHDAMVSLQPLGLDLSNPELGLSKTGVDITKHIFANPKLTRAVDQLIYHSQQEGAGAVKTLGPEHAKTVGILSGLSADEKVRIQNLVRMKDASTLSMFHNVMNKMSNISSHYATQILWENGKRSSENFQLASTTLQAMMDLSDPQKAPVAQQMLAGVQGELTIPQFNELTKYMQAEVGKLKTFQQFAANNPGWTTARRYGKYLVEYWEGGKPVLEGAESVKEAEQKAAGRTLTDRGIWENKLASDDEVPGLGFDQASLQRLAEAQAVQDKIMEQRLAATPGAFEEYKRASAFAQMATEQSTHGAPLPPGLTPRARELSKGAEKIPFMENHILWIQKTANYWQRMEFRAMAESTLLDPEMRANPELAKKVRDHTENVLSRDPEVARQAVRFVATWMLGLRPSTAIITASHFTIRHTSEMTRVSGSMLEGFKRVTAALGDIVKEGTSRTWAHPEHEWLNREAVRTGNIDRGWFTDEDSAGETTSLDFLALAKGQRPQTAGQRLGHAANMYSRVAMWMFQQARIVNEKSALYTSYHYYRDQGMTREQARDEAFKFNHAVNPVGGRAQRPIGLAHDVPRTPMMMGYSLHSYVLGTIGQLGRYIMDSSDWLSREAIAPSEKFAARKAAGQMLVMQAAAAGLLGLPGVTAATAVLHQLGIPANKKLREAVDDFFAKDGEQGSPLTDMALYGLPSMLGWDFHSRLTMGNIVPGVDETQGFQPQQLLGPPVNLLLNFLRGAKKLSNGESSGLTDLMPTAVKDVVNLVKSDGTAKDYKDRPLFQTTPGEQVGQLLGFRPLRLTEENAAERETADADRAAGREQGRWSQEMAQGVLAGNFGQVRLALLDKLRSEKGFDPKRAGEAIAHAAEELTFPRDLRRLGSAGPQSAERERLLATFRLPENGQVTEMQRLQFRTAVLQRLGLPDPGTYDQELAQMMDQLKASGLDLPRPELRRRAQHQLHGLGE